jgi:hypothetical protein
MSQISYSDGNTAVELGDFVSARVWVRRRSGNVIYIPGISARVGSFDHNGLTWVGIAFSSGTVIGSLVDPETARLQRTVRFLGRAALHQQEATSLLQRVEAEDPDEPEPPDGDAAAVETRPPRLIDWVAGLVSLLLYAAIWGGVITAVALGVRFIWRLF